MDNESKSPIQSIDRVFNIVETMSNFSRGISLSELSSLVGFTPSTVHRFLSALMIRGYVCKDTETGKYRLTARLYDIGAKVIPGLNLVNTVSPFLEKLAEISEETVHLVSREGNEVVYLVRQDAYPSIINMGSRVGLRNPMYCTGVGKSILAFLQEDEVSSIWNNTDIVKYTDTTIMTYQELRKELIKIHENGYAIDNEEHETGIRCLATPLFNSENKPFAAISISGMATRMTDEKINRLVPIIMRTAHSISELYGQTMVANTN